MSAWSFVLLGELAAPVRHSCVGGPFGSELTSKDYVAGPGVPVIRGANLGEHGAFRDHGFVFVSEAKAESLRANQAVSGDVIFTQRGTIGQVATIPKSAQFDRYLISQSQMKLTPDAARVESRYLVHYFLSPPALRFLEQNTLATGVPHINLSILKRMPVPLPPLGEQRRIADILDKADAIRRKRKEAIALTDELLRSAFLHTVGPNTEGYSRWKEVPLEDLAAQAPNAMRTGPFGSDLRHSEFVSHGVAVLGIDNAVQNRFAWGERRFITPEKYETLKRYAVRPGDVMVTIMGTTGRSAVVPEDIPTAITTKHLATITLNQSLAHPEFVSQSFHSHPELLAQIESAGRGAIMNGLNLGLIRALRVRVPPMSQQRSFVAQVNGIRVVESRMLMALHESEALFASLLHRAFRGELTAPTSRPASPTTRQLSLLE